MSFLPSLRQLKTVLISIILYSMLGMESGLFASTTLDCCIPFFLLHILAMPRDANFWGSKMWRLSVFYPPRRPPPPPALTALEI